jgi:methanogenic corrinoid protein MtbC1
MANDGDLDLNTLNDDELVQQVHDDLYDGLKEEIEAAVHIFLKRGWTPYDVLTKALVEGMRIVGVDFRDGILFVPEVLLAANAMKAGMVILRPLLAETGAPKVGKMVIGTVKGDIHDIGKNLVSMMMEGAGFEVIDLGINNPVEKYLEAIEEHQPDILGMSALLTTTMPYMKVVVDAMVEKGIARITSCSSAARRSTKPSRTRSVPTPIVATPRWPSKPPRPSWPSARVRPSPRSKLRQEISRFSRPRRPPGRRGFRLGPEI